MVSTAGAALTFSGAAGGIFMSGLSGKAASRGLAAGAVGGGKAVLTAWPGTAGAGRAEVVTGAFPARPGNSVVVAGGANANCVPVAAAGRFTAGGATGGLIRLAASTGGWLAD